MVTRNKWCDRGGHTKKWCDRWGLGDTICLMTASVAPLFSSGQNRTHHVSRDRASLCVITRHATSLVARGKNAHHIHLTTRGGNIERKDWLRTNIKSQPQMPMFVRGCVNVISTYGIVRAHASTHVTLESTTCHATSLQTRLGRVSLW